MTSTVPGWIDAAGCRTTCPPGARSRTRWPITRSATRGDPPDRARAGPLVPRHASRATPCVRDHVRQPLGTRGQHGRAPAVPRRADGPRGADPVRGLAAARRPGRDHLPDDAVAALDGRALARRLEDDPLESGELCVVEIFGRSIGDGRSTEVGMGVKQPRDPRLSHDFEAPRLAIDIGLDQATRSTGTSTRQCSAPRLVIRRCRRPPSYRMPSPVTACSTSPRWSNGHDDQLVPTLEVKPDHVSGVSGRRGTLRHPGRPQRRDYAAPGQAWATPPPREPAWS